MRSIAMAISGVNLLGGLLLAVSGALRGPVPWSAWVVAAVLALMGTSILVWLMRGVEASRLRLLLAAAWVELTAGGAAAGLVLVQNLQAPNPDPEYGVMVALGMVGLHGLVTVLALRTTQPDGRGGTRDVGPNVVE